MTGEIQSKFFVSELSNQASRTVSIEKRNLIFSTLKITIDHTLKLFLRRNYLKMVSFS